jgi:AcrR family transcriptional regulator
MNAPARKRDSKASRQRILEAARTLLAERGGDFEMAWIARLAGASQGLAYHHFGSKEGLLGAVVHDFYDRVEDAVLMARFDDYDDWEARERDRVHRYIKFLLNDPLGITVITRLASAPAVAVVEAERWEKLIEAGSRNIAEGQAKGVVTANQDSTLLAAMALGATRAAVAKEFSKNKPATPAHLTRDIWGFIRSGLGLKENT